tara:strand:- start:11 stop:292 length:282 start_codon:yes stop_codon:yes gene_type:complete
MFVNALLFRNVDEKLITFVLYLNNSFGTVTKDVHALNVDANEDTPVLLLNKPDGIDVIFVNEKVSTNSYADVEKLNKPDGIDVILVPLNVLFH